MMMQMLAAGGVMPLTDNVRGADEDNPLGYYEFEPVKRTRDDPSWLDDAVGKAVKMAHLLLTDLPLDREYRVIFMRRNLDEVLASQQKMLARRNLAGGNLPPERLKQVFVQQLARLETWLNQQACFQRLNLSYNELLDAPATSAQTLIDFLELGDVGEQMVACVVPDLYRNRR